MRTALQHHRAKLRERHKRHQRQAEVAANRYLLLQDRSFLPMRQEGAQAFKDGKLRRDNPYEVLSGEFVHWDVGYMDCQNRNS